MYSKTAQHHLKTKLSRRVKRRKPATAPANKAVAKNLRKLVINI